MQIIRAIDKGIRQTDLAKQYGVVRAMISVLYENRDQVVQALASLPKKFSKNMKSNHVEIDSALLNRFTIKSHKNIPISGYTMIEKADQHASSLEIPEL